jgi:hypothetical protein
MTNWVKDSSTMSPSFSSLLSGSRFAEKDEDRILEEKVRQVVQEIFEEQELPWKERKEYAKPRKIMDTCPDCGAVGMLKPISKDAEILKFRCLSCGWREK